MEPKDFEALHLSREETREIITPYAFKIEKSLLGRRLATPYQRAVAMAIDGFFVVVLAKLSASIVMAVAALALYRGTSHSFLPGHHPWLRGLLRASAAITLFICGLMFLGWLIDVDEHTSVKVQEKTLSAEHRAAAELYLSKIDNEDCLEACERELLKGLGDAMDADSLEEVQQLGSLAVRKQVAKGIIAGLLAGDDKQAEKLDPASNDKQSSKVEQTTDNSDTSTSEGCWWQGAQDIDHRYSVIKWLKGLLEEFGFGFGWAAAYFSLFPLLWNGQTLGKSLMKIRIIKLNGLPLTLWDCFGRYGGYGAGFATGLAGFLQVFWDPNRQAIQDKISGTVLTASGYGTGLDQLEKAGEQSS